MNGRVTPNFVLALIGIAACVAFMVFLPTLAKANERKVTHLLAVVFFAEADTRRPHIVAPMYSADECNTEAARQNKTDEQMRRPDLRALGAEYVCLAIERVKV